MGHSLIIGATRSGKTRLAITIANEWKKRQRPIIVIDCKMDRRWPVMPLPRLDDVVLERLKKERGLFIVVDESSQVLGRYPPAEYEWLATVSAGYQHSCLFICQESSQISPTVRGQCDTLYMFHCNVGSRKLLVDNYHMADPGPLPKLHFIRADRFSAAGMYSIDPATGKIKFLKGLNNDSTTSGVGSDTGTSSKNEAKPRGRSS